MTRPAILLADALTALRGLGVTDAETRERVLRLLGLGLAPAAAPAPGEVTTTPEPARTTSVPVAAVPRLDAVQPATGDGESPVPIEIAVVPRLKRREATAAAPARVLDEPGHTGPAPPHEPLLRPRWTRGIVATCVSTQADDGPLDLPAIVERIARGDVLEELPRLPAPTTRHGVQVLVDLGPGMQPFATDQVQLLAELERILGAHKTHVLYFAGAPVEAGPGHERTWRPYTPPDGGTPVLLLSDLGAGRRLGGLRPADPRTWRRVLDTMRRAEAPAVALVPYPRERVPAALRGALPIVRWDRTTTARAARAAVGRVLEVVR